ncbi:translocation/assembly module TamB domain-containing protein [Spirosoma utsteinense]|uniref:translocation/assembly module TamB domain-containing protein n=1 Tax=Spirosoma utsteinense TaxID=2585773 RepID=UPI001645DE44|nr:translocation/assembly module TamB domain-containing protein [Spirosoma utsteinense]MBC3787662.1 autotransporter translocation and assembly factor TamB [Spirosoma utsteinense]
MTKALVRILIGLFALILLLVGFVMLVATTPWGQQLVTKQVNSYLAGKLNSPFRIGRVRYAIPDYIELENVFFKTPKGDTLLDGGRMRVDLDMWGLLHNRVAINTIDLEHIRLNINRIADSTGTTPPAFNFQYILDAFIPPGDTTKPTTPVDTTVAPLDINLASVFLKDVRIKYRDDVVGADVNAYVDSLRAGFDKTDVTNSRYYLSNVAVNGLNAYTRLYEGIPTPDDPSAPSDTLDIRLGKWQVNKAKWDVRVETADFRTQGTVGKLAMESDYFYLNGSKIGIKSLDMADGDIAAVLTRPTKKAAPARSTASVVSTPDVSTPDVSTPDVSTPDVSTPGWQAKIGTVRFANNRIRYDDETAARQKRGLDYGHLDLRNLGVEGKALAYQDLGTRGQRVSGQIRNAQFKATSGFTLQQFDADVLYDDKNTRLTGMLIKTPTSLLRDQVILRYDSLAQLSDPRFAKRVSIRANLRQSRLSVMDVLQLAPFLADTPPFTDPRAVFRADAQATGTLAALTIPRFGLDMLSGTHVRMSGRLTNVTDPDRIGLDLVIKDATTRLADINKLAPKGSIPSSIALPPLFDLTGRIKGQLNNLVLDANLRTDWGTAAFDGKLAGFVTGKNQTYQGTLDLTAFDAGKWLKQEGTVGKLTGRATFNGRGIDVNTLTTRFDLNVQSAELSGYRYQNLDATGNLANGNLTLTGGLKDPNANLTLDIKAGLKGEFPSVTGEAVVQELNLQQLKLYNDPLSLKGRIVLDMPSTDPAKPVGTVSATDAVVTLNGKNYPVDALYAKLSADGKNKKVDAQLPGAQVALNGQFEYTQLYDIVVGEISKYLAIPALTYKTIPPPYAFTVNMKAYQNPLFQAFVPALTRLDTVRLDAYLDNLRDTTLSATVRTGTIVYDTTTIQGATLALRGINNQLKVAGRVDGILYDDLKIRETLLTGTAANNRFRFAVVNKDSIGQDLHALAGTLSIVDSSYRFQFARDGLMTSYQRWTADTSGFVQYGTSGVMISTLRLEQDNQLLEVGSTELYGNAPIRVTTRGIQLANLARLANQDTTLAAGELNGTVVVRDYMTEDSQLAFIGSVYVDSLRVMAQPIGNLTARFRNNSDGRIDVNTTLAGPYNDATVVGFYNPENAKQALDLTINLKRLDARTIEAFSFGELRQAKGKLVGEFTVNGSADNPQLNGSVAFDSVAFNIKQLNATYRIDQEKLNFAGQTITLNDFNVRDTLGRTLTTDGTVVLKNLPDATYNLRVRAANFQVLNAARKDNDYAYGQAAVTADLRVKGAGTNASINGTVKLEDGSKVSVVLPDESVDVNEANGIVTFIDHNDSLALGKYIYRPKRDSVTTRLAFDQLTNANISLDLEADEKSELTIIVDELNGDYLRARGNARLNVTVNAAGQLSVLGRYEVTEGEYSLTYQVLKRQFEIQKGGYINFSGDPLKADLNITAIYKVSVPPGDLVGNESSSLDASAAKRKLPFNVALSMSNNLAAPKLDFDIRLSGVDQSGQAASSPIVTTIENKLTTLRQDQSQINKQVFALLILNRFLPENTSDFFSGSGGGGLNSQAEGVARSSVSKLISDQLGQLASNVLKGFDVDFNLLSQTGSANTGGTTNGARTDLNVGLSRSFLEGRITVSVGKNFVLENAAGAATSASQVFDNLSVNYSLTRDSRYVLRAYRSNNYQAVLDGFVIETGVGFIITFDYNTISEMFRKTSVGTADPSTTSLN